MAFFALRVVTPEGTAVETEAESLVLPGAAGSLGALRGHEPWTVLLAQGAIEYRLPGGEWKSYPITAGVASIEGERTLVLADR